MKLFYRVTFSLMTLGLAILCVRAPWTQPDATLPNAHATIGYAPVWSQSYAQIPGAHVDWNGAFAAYAAAVVFFAIVGGAIAYFFREKRGKPETHRTKPHSH